MVPDTAGVVAPMDTVGVVITQLLSTPAYPFSNPSLSPTRQHPCTTPHTSLGGRRLETLFEETQEEVTYQSQDSPYQSQDSQVQEQTQQMKDSKTN